MDKDMASEGPEFPGVLNLSYTDTLKEYAEGSIARIWADKEVDEDEEKAQI